MLKLFKYEWRKQIFSKVVIGCILLGLAGLYMAGTLFNKEGWQEIALAFLVFMGMFCAAYVGVESLLVLNRDLKTKEGHMLFMVPCHAFEILGAKILAAICQILLTMVLFAAAFGLCFSAYLAANDGFAQFLNLLRELVEEWGQLDIRWEEIGLVLAELFLMWISTIAVGFFSIISVRTVFARSKFATLFAVLVFFALNWGINWIFRKIMSFADGWQESLTSFWINFGVIAAITVLLLYLSGWMAEKKLSV